MIENYKCDNCGKVTKDIVMYSGFDLCKECDKKHKEIYIDGLHKLETEVEEFMQRIRKEFPNIWGEKDTLRLVWKRGK